MININKLDTKLNTTINSSPVTATGIKFTQPGLNDVQGMPNPLSGEVIESLLFGLKIIPPAGKNPFEHREDTGE